MRYILLLFIVLSSSISGFAQVIFPGDLNNDSQANYLDLLPLGLAYGQEGPPRPGASLEWIQQPNFPWDGFLPVSGINLGFVDSDGNGFIDSLDIDAIALNYDSLQFTSEPLPQPYLLTDTFAVEELPELIIRFDRDTVAIGDTITLVLDYIVPNPDVFPPTAAPLAIAFTLEYADTLLSGEQTIIQPDTVPGDLLFVAATSNTAGFWRSPAPGQIEFAASGKGVPALANSRTLGKMLIVIEDMILLSQPLPLKVKNPLLINTAEQVIALKTSVSPLWITGQASEPEHSHKVKVFPNPTSGLVQVQLPSPTPLRLRLFSIAGQCLVQMDYQLSDYCEVDLSALGPGIYFLQLQTSEGVQVERVVVSGF